MRKHQKEFRLVFFWAITLPRHPATDLVLSRVSYSTVVVYSPLVMVPTVQPDRLKSAPG